MSKIKVAIIGLGGRGYGLLRLCLVKMKDIEIVSVCDTYIDRAEKAAKLINDKCGYKPIITKDYNDVITMIDVEAVIITTSWEDHIKIACEAMKNGKYVGMEVGGAYNLKDCFELVKVSEETGKWCMLLENCCYGKYELMALTMMRQGVFGDIVHCEGGYCHDLRNEIANGEKNRHYRLRNYLTRNCENYPTHELGPICKILRINNGNRLISLSSFSSPSKGLHQYIENNLSNNKELLNAEFQQGDIVTTVIKTSLGQTIVLSLDTTLPRTYSRRLTIRGTKAMYLEDNNSVFIDGKHNIAEFNPHLIWNNAKKYAKKYSHELWNYKNRKSAKGAGHGGMDWLVLRAFIETISEKAYPPIDVYDTALWMSITALSEQSIKGGGCVVEIPDFTHGNWKKRTVGVIEKFNLD